MSLTVEQGARVLTAIGYQDDIVYRHGKQTSAREMASGPIRNSKAKTVWVEYHVAGARKKRGTFYQLVLERIRNA